MALDKDTKVKLAAGVYGDFVTNGEVNNPNPNFGYKPNFDEGTHEEWIEELLSGDDTRIKQALTTIQIDNQTEQEKVVRALPKDTDCHVALAIYKKLKAEVHSHRPKDAEAGSHDY